MSNILSENISSEKNRGKVEYEEAYKKHIVKDYVSYCSFNVKW